MAPRISVTGERNGVAGRWSVVLCLSRSASARRSCGVKVRFQENYGINSTGSSWPKTGRQISGQSRSSHIHGYGSSMGPTLAGQASDGGAEPKKPRARMCALRASALQWHPAARPSRASPERRWPAASNAPAPRRRHPW